LIARRDADGNTTTYGYSNGQVTQITDASGQITYLDYSGTNLSQIRTVSNGVELRFPQQNGQFNCRHISLRILLVLGSLKKR
jgi:YD repeat-containing protein